MGLQRRFFEFVYADFYFGGGIRTAKIKEEHHYPPGTIIGRRYNEYDLFDPAYEGIYPIIGVKLGVPL